MAKQRGVVLVIVLWVMTLLTIIAGSFAYSLRIETTLATHAVDQARARAAVEAGVAYAMVQVLNPPPEEADRWPVDGRTREWYFGEARLEISVRDTSGRIDINRADRELLRGLFEVVGGLDESRSDSLLDAIEDFRDADDLVRLNGAEEPEYLAAGRDFGPKNALFESIEELQQVLGMDNALYSKVADFLTVYSNQAGVNPTLAAPEVLYSVPGIDPSVVELFLLEREESRLLDEPFTGSLDLGSYLSQAQGLAYDVNVSASFETGTAAFVSATVTQGRQPDKPFQLLTWREGRAAVQPASDPNLDTPQ